MYSSRIPKTGKQRGLQKKNEVEEDVTSQKSFEQHPNTSVQASRDVVQQYADSTTSNLNVQPKLQIGEQNDKFEQEADKTADEVVTKHEVGSSFSGSDDTRSDINKKEFLSTEGYSSEKGTQRKEIQKKEFLQTVLYNEGATSPRFESKAGSQIIKKEFLQAVFLPDNENTQAPTDERADLIQKKEFIRSVSEGAVQKKESGETISKKEFLKQVLANVLSLAPKKDEVIEALLAQSKGSGNKLSTSVLKQMEASFQYDFSNVRIHTDSRAVQMCVKLGARAFTNGNDIYFNDGEFDPISSLGRHLLAHELTHVIQQAAGKKQLQLKAKDPKDDPNFAAISPKRARANRDNLLLYENTETTIGVAIQNGQMLAIQYASKDGKWYFAETLDPSRRSGYILQKYILDAADIKPPAADPNVDPKIEQDNNQNSVNDEVVKTDPNALTDSNNENSDKEKDGPKKKGELKASKLNQSFAKDKKKQPDLINAKSTGPFKLGNVDVNKLDKKKEYSKFKRNALSRKKKVKTVVNGQITLIKKVSKLEQAKINTDAKLASGEVKLSYNWAIREIRKEYFNTLLGIGTTFIKQKARINTERDQKIVDLESGTTERVNRLKSEGEKVAKGVELNAASEVLRIARNRLQIKVNLDNLIKFLIDFYNATDRRARMQRRLGTLRDEALLTIDESNEELIEGIIDQSNDLAENIREQYNDAAEDLPDQTEYIKDDIRALAENAITEMDNIMIQPMVDEMNTNITLLITRLEIERDEVLGQIEQTRVNAIGEIITEEVKRIGELKANLKRYTQGVDEIIKQIDKEKDELPDGLAIELMLLGTHQVDKSFEELKADALNGTTLLVEVFLQAYQSVFKYFDTTRLNVIGQNEESVKNTKSQLEIAGKAIGKVYIDVADRVVLDMKGEVDEILKTLDESINKCIVELTAEKDKFARELKKPVDEALIENLKLRNETRSEIFDEAEQLATEWEITYGLRRIGEALWYLFKGLLTIILWIVAIIVALILLILLIIVLIVTGVVDAIIAAVLAILRFVLPAFLRWIGQIIVRLIGQLLRWVVTNLFRVLVRLLTSTLGRIFMSILAFWMIGEGLGMIWEGMTRDDLPASERQKLVNRGIVYVVTSVVAEWKLLKTTFKLTQGYKQFKALAGVLGSARTAARLVNFAKGDLALATTLGSKMTATQIRGILPFADDAIELNRVLGLFGDDAARIEGMLIRMHTDIRKIGIITDTVGDAAVAESLLAKIGSGDDLIALLVRMPAGGNYARLNEVLAILPRAGGLSDDGLRNILQFTDNELRTMQGMNILQVEHRVGIIAANRADALVTRLLPDILVNGRIPLVDGGGFSRWFDELTAAELQLIRADRRLNRTLGDRIRAYETVQGSQHEWYMVAESQVFKELRISMFDIRGFRTRISDLRWTVPNDVATIEIRGLTGGHGATGSTTFHNELQMVIQNNRFNLEAINGGIRDLLVRWQIDPNLLPPFPIR